MAVKVKKSRKRCRMCNMSGTDPHLLVFSIVGLGTLVSLLSAIGTWHLSRAKKVRLLEDQIVSASRAQRERVDSMETKLAEWHVTMQAVLAEAEEFFSRSVKERKRAHVAVAREEAANATPRPFEVLNRADQIDSLRAHFQGRDS